MKPILLLLLTSSTLFLSAQKSIPLPITPTPGIVWQGPEKQYYSEIWKTEVVTNVSKPTLEIFLAPDSINTGTSVVIAPGGGLYAHSIESEGNMVARWLQQKGINAFVLKYRLVPSGQDGVADLNRKSAQDKTAFLQEVKEVLAYSITDGLHAVTYLRQNAKTLSIDPKKIGFMGFSAGGAVTMGVAYSATEATRPDFLVPIYPWADAMPVQIPENNAPPLLVICATDDPLDLAAPAVDLYSAWQQKNLPAAMHMYSKGGHGFGMRTQNLPSDGWIQRFYDWSIAEGLTKAIE